MKTAGSLRTPTTFIASCHWPLGVEPSPNHVMATRGSLRIWNASARPQVTSAMSGSIDTIPTQPSSLSPKCMLPSLPPVARAEREGGSHGDRLLPASVVVRAGHLALAVERERPLLGGTHEEHVAQE